ncbi:MULTISPECIES: hypothetical protein [Virgibacillus]|uniref:Sigma-X negative effector n=2 Tax=Virgibacillus TaxID=84406 RepID=A0A024QB53_9BACI|nr:MULTISPECIES: hypothetical protein [Virgibacillus]EQB36078.1 hypothetical protein M948_13660 [Virgibacillus sp. CM-4]MYL41943.1 hypothetical protein [Virgibacillus massiliensis]GGJ46815.1 hypothetical protein GCM10007111_06030 [Virgibacillus kapii]CDQ39773.1 Sigma-X negative effector [Virgibacillus massiliensis]
MNKDEKKQNLKNRLKHLPEVTDHRSKKEVYQKFLLQMEKNEKNKRNKRLLPVTALITAAIILILIVPGLFNSFQTSEDNTSEWTANQEDRSSVETDASRDVNRIETKEEHMAVDPAKENDSYVLHELPSNHRVLYASIADEQIQHTIPFAFVVSANRELDTAYNHLDQYIDRLKINQNQYLFHGITYQIDEDAKRVTLQLPDHFALGEGSAVPRMFERMVGNMFRPYGIDMAYFSKGNKDQVDLGALGNVNSLSIEDTVKYSYKLYERNNQRHLIEISNNESESIDAAIQKLQTRGKNKYIKQTIPKELQYQVSTANDLLQFTLTNNVELTNRNGILLIESILMTAKSYEYNRVKFNNFSSEQIGEYDLTKPVPVPKAVNPVEVN